MVKQGDIIFINLDPSLGHEQKKSRPALVVSNTKYNKHCNGMVIICPISHSKNNFPLHVTLPEGLKTDGKVLCEHVRSVDLNARRYRIIESVNDDFLQLIISYIKAEIN